ncbi:MAG: hypothetical protein M4579_001759 [Chaenotheca gracillima]|nr:MAG: hypothetical protein M4579_001759 [Chaenotheca gracillima]
MAQTHPMEARVGRKMQRYGPQGERLIAGIVPLSENKTMVLVLQSQGRPACVLPKGGWETDESTAQVAACREAWEEAGIRCKNLRDLGTIQESRPSTETASAQKKSAPPKAVYHFFEATVTEEEENWPEQAKRTRVWVTYNEALDKLKEKPELIEALNRSAIKGKPTDR